MATDRLDCDTEFVSLEYDYYDLHQKPSRVPASFDVTEEEQEENFEKNSHAGLENSRVVGNSHENSHEDGHDDVEDLDIEILNLDDYSPSEAVEAALNADPCIVETEFLRGRKGKPGVRVRFQDLSKPYIAQVTNEGNYVKFLQIVREGEDVVMSPDSGINELQNLSEEEQEKQKAEWRSELARIEDEINTLKHVLASKTKAAQELKKKLGFSVWKEFNDDISQSISNIKETTVYQSAESLVKPVAEKATNILGGFGSGISTKLGQIKSSESFRSFEEKVGSAYENVKHLLVRTKLTATGEGSDHTEVSEDILTDGSSGFQTKVSTSRSSSIQSFDEALNAGSRNVASPASTPVIPEEKEIK